MELFFVRIEGRSAHRESRRLTSYLLHVVSVHQYRMHCVYIPASNPFTCQDKMVTYTFCVQKALKVSALLQRHDYFGASAYVQSCLPHQCVSYLAFILVTSAFTPFPAGVLCKVLLDGYPIACTHSQASLRRVRLLCFRHEPDEQHPLLLFAEVFSELSLEQKRASSWVAAGQKKVSLSSKLVNSKQITPHGYGHQIVMLSASLVRFMGLIFVELMPIGRRCRTKTWAASSCNSQGL